MLFFLSTNTFQSWWNWVNSAQHKLAAVTCTRRQLKRRSCHPSSEGASWVQHLGTGSGGWPFRPALLPHPVPPLQWCPWRQVPKVFHGHRHRTRHLHLSTAPRLCFSIRELNVPMNKGEGTVLQCSCLPPPHPHWWQWCSGSSFSRTQLTAIPNTRKREASRTLFHN